MLPALSDLEQRVAALFALWRVAGVAAVTVTWNARLRTTAGRAFPGEQRVELNPTLLGDNPGELDAVLVHEAAHLAAARLFGPRVVAHGRHWRALMRLAGLEPEVTHDLPVPRLRRRRRSHVFLRVCDACGARRIARVVRYDACACGSGDRFLVLRAPATEGGLRALRRMSVAEARRRYATG